MSDHKHPHDAPPNPYFESHRSEQDDEALTARVRKIEQVLIEKGVVKKDALQKLADIYENDLGPMNGARVVARAWVDPDFKKRLLEDGTAGIRELGYGGLDGEHMVVVENTPEVHNVVVCTLCSCYPWPVLGLPPTWYKSAAYRSKVVIDPRSVLNDFGTTLDEGVEVRVWDSSADVRYIVLPERPTDTDGMTEEQLADIVNRDSMIGVTKVQIQ